MAERYTSRLALVTDGPVDDVGEVVRAAVAAGDLDRGAPVGDGREAHEVNWGGRMQKAVVRTVVEDDRDLLRIEAYVGSEGTTAGMQRQAQLLQALARQLRGRVTGVVDLSARAERDLAWVNRLAVGAVERGDAIVVAVGGEGTLWLHSHGAARFDVPDLELYGVIRSQVEAGTALLAHVHGQLLDRGLKGALTAPDGTPLYLVPVLEAWQELPLDWPGIGRAGVDRGPGLDGPRATLSVLHKPRLGRYRKDFKGVLALL